MQDEEFANLSPEHLAERYTLGSILLDELVFARAKSELKPSDFACREHRLIWQAMADVKARDEEINEATVCLQLQSTGDLQDVGSVYVTELVDLTPSAATADRYIRKVKEAAILREIEFASMMAQRATREEQADSREVLSKASRALVAIEERSSMSVGITSADIAKVVGREIHELREGTRDVGRKTGFRDLDAIILGLQPQNLVIIAARPGVGKTTLALNIMANMAVRQKLQCAFFSLEMSAAECAKRFISAQARLPGDRMKQPRLLADGDYIRYDRAMSELQNAPIHWFDNTTRLADIRAKAHALHTQRKLDVLFVDYLQLVGAERGESREREVSEVSRGLKQLGRELNVPVIVPAQLNREVEKRTSKRPTLADLRESGSIEQDADIVAFIFREDMYSSDADKNTAELIIAKHRNGPCGSVQLRYNGEYSRFDNLHVGHGSGDDR